MMIRRCSLCAKPMDGGGNICESCQERIRAEAMGRQLKALQQTHKGLEKLDVSNKKSTTVTEDSAVHHEEEEEIMPHHFKSMAKYLEYLKGKMR